MAMLKKSDTNMIKELRILKVVSVPMKAFYTICPSTNSKKTNRNRNKNKNKMNVRMRMNKNGTKYMRRNQQRRLKDIVIYRPSVLGGTVSSSLLRQASKNTDVKVDIQFEEDDINSDSDSDSD